MNRIEWTQRFREARAVGQIKLRCCQYLQAGRKEGLTTMQLIDELGISSPSILDQAHYSEREKQATLDLIATLSDDEISLA